MKKIISTFLLLISLGSCGGESKESVQTGKKLETPAFELYYRKDWTETKGEIDFATVYSLDSLQLLSFSRAPLEGMGKTVMSFEDTYKTFESSFASVGTTEEISTNNGIDMEIIKYKNIEKAFIFDVTSAMGTVAIWNDGKTSYALIDQNDMHQADGEFKSIYESFKYLN